MTPQTETPTWLRLEDAAKHLTVSPAWLDRSDCPRARLGRRVIFYRDELDAFALAHMTHRVHRGDR